MQLARASASASCLARSPIAMPHFDAWTRSCSSRVEACGCSPIPTFDARRECVVSSNSWVRQWLRRGTRERVACPSSAPAWLAAAPSQELAESGDRAALFSTPREPGRVPPTMAPATCVEALAPGNRVAYDPILGIASACSASTLPRHRSRRRRAQKEARR